jgi:uncharacterized protein YndB with AHSA1/START domain
MSTVNLKTTVQASPESVWTTLFEDPNQWPRWLSPLRGLEEAVSGPIREGTEFHVRIGKLSGKVRVVEATRGRRLRWSAGPGMMLAMGMGMKGTIELQRSDGSTHVSLTHKAPTMMMPMMKMMSGLDPKQEMTETISRIKHLGER